MKFIHIVFIASITFFSVSTFSADQVQKTVAAKKAVVSSTTSSTTSSGAVQSAATCGSMDKMDEQMIVMREMHQKMMNAKTPEERQALRAEHLKAMQGGMAMMGAMSSCGGMMNAVPHPGAMMGMKSEGIGAMRNHMKTEMKCDMNDMGAHYKMMETRMHMMETTMQMMLDRIGNDSFDDYVENAMKK